MSEKTSGKTPGKDKKIKVEQAAKEELDKAKAAGYTSRHDVTECSVCGELYPNSEIHEIHRCLYCSVYFCDDDYAEHVRTVQ